MTTGAQLTFLEPGLAAGALENMPLRLQFRLCGSLTFRRLAGANAGRLPLPQQLLPWRRKTGKTTGPADH